MNAPREASVSASIHYHGGNVEAKYFPADSTSEEFGRVQIGDGLNDVTVFVSNAQDADKLADEIRRLARMLRHPSN